MVVRIRVLWICSDRDVDLDDQARPLGRRLPPASRGRQERRQIQTAHRQPENEQQRVRFKAKAPTCSCSGRLRNRSATACVSKTCSGAKKQLLFYPLQGAKVRFYSLPLYPHCPNNLTEVDSRSTAVETKEILAQNSGRVNTQRGKNENSWP